MRIVLTRRLNNPECSASRGLFGEPSRTSRDLSRTCCRSVGNGTPAEMGFRVLAFGREAHMLRDFLFLILFFVLLGVWATAWLAFHVAGGLIHLLLVFAVISLLMQLFRGRRTT